MVISRLLVASLSLLCAGGVLAQDAIAGQAPQQVKAIQAVQRTQAADTLEVAVETRIVTLGEMAEQFQNLAGFLGTGGDIPIQPGSVAFLNSRQAKSWMELFQRERTTDVMQAPKCTMLSGQQVKINVGDELTYLESVKVVEVNGQKVFQPQQKTCETGLRANVLPTVSADRQSVKLHYALTLTSVGANIPLIPVQMADDSEPCLFIQQPWIQTLTLDKTLILPDGGTAVFYLGKTLVESRNEYGPPVLSKIPYLSRLFTRVGYGRETRPVFLMVTTRVIVNEDEVSLGHERSK